MKIWILYDDVERARELAAALEGGSDRTELTPLTGEGAAAPADDLARRALDYGAVHLVLTDPSSEPVAVAFLRALARFGAARIPTVRLAALEGDRWRLDGPPLDWWEEELAVDDFDDFDFDDDVDTAASFGGAEHEYPDESEGTDGWGGSGDDDSFDDDAPTGQLPSMSSEEYGSVTPAPKPMSEPGPSSPRDDATGAFSIPAGPVHSEPAALPAKGSALGSLFGALGRLSPARLFGRRSRSASPPVTGEVHFTVTTPERVEAGRSYVLDLWAHLDSMRDEVLERARGAAGDEGVRAAATDRRVLREGTVLEARLYLPGLQFEEPVRRFVWRGQLEQVPFVFAVPYGFASGRHPGRLALTVEGLSIATLGFTLEIGGARGGGSTTVRPFKSAFASYASEDRDEMLARVQGMQSAVPDLEVFVDVASLRAGQRWQLELERAIHSREVFYLFWSRAAAASEWVEREWRMALERPGLDRIAPVPLDSPAEVPPPAELGDELHFNDWTLAFRGDSGR